jgi:hypothetical protein
MRLKEVTLWALISMILLTILVVSDFVVVIVDFVQAPRGALLVLFTSAVHLLASASVTAFFYTSYRNRR